MPKKDMNASINPPAAKNKTAWQLHLKEYRSKNPQSSLKQAMQEASKTYTKPSKD